jgi:hypothetical protein
LPRVVLARRAGFSLLETDLKFARRGLMPALRRGLKVRAREAALRFLMTRVTRPLLLRFF